MLTDFESHALPVETHIPKESSRSNKDSASTSGKRILKMPVLFENGSSNVVANRILFFVHASTNLCFKESVCAIRSSINRTASSKATAIPTAPATFSVPARIFRSCPPPQIMGYIGTPLRTYSAPIPRGPLNL